MLKIQESVFLKDYSTFKIGGLARYFVLVKSISQLIESLEWAKKNNLPLLLLGEGSNILFSDEGYKGLIIKIQISEIKTRQNVIICGAGTLINEMLSVTTAKGLTGFEWAAGIPGTIGGAIFGNAGAFDWEMKNITENVKGLNLKDFKIKDFKNEDCQFSYRSSIFKKEKKYAIIEAELKLKKGDQENILKMVKKNLLYRKERHPLEYPSVGSIFKNIKFTKENLKITKTFPDLRQFLQRGEIPVAQLIHYCGLKGKKIGGAQISEKHPNFIVNIDNATAEDVITLINLIKQKVRDKFGIQLEKEIIVI